jgi:signal transduction histidine kinase
MHTLQTLGSIGMVLLICKKNVPKYFTSSNIFLTMFFTTLTSIASIWGFGHDMLYLPNILTYVFMGCGMYFLVWKISFPWMRDIWFFSISKKKPLSIEESCAIWYFMNTMVILMFVHSMVCIIKLFDWTNYDSIDINVFVYSFALYSVINSTVPGRLARIAVDNERKKMVQTKRALIRYMSHEVRSPLNVIYSGLNLLIEDIGSLPPTEGNSNLLETFDSIRHASADLLQTMNDLLLMESMDSAAFSIEEKMVPCANLTQIAEKCGLVPREKGIVFTVNNQFDHPNHNMMMMVKGQPDLPTDIELGNSTTDPDPTTEQADSSDEQLLLFIDEHKIGQVLRNLITNSAKFTPPGQSIAVNIRPATAVDLTEAEYSNGSKNHHDDEEDEEEGISGRRARALAFAEENGYAPCGQVIIEVQDTGVGIAPENWGKVFGQFAQFDANKLQVSDGGCNLL